MELTEETKTLLEMLRHNRLVRAFIAQLSNALGMRGLEHDTSKFGFDEFGTIVRIKGIARRFAYGSPEYGSELDANREALNAHLLHNSHHPECHAGGIDDMSLLDIVEMVCDWKAANAMYGKPTWEEAVKIHTERFGLKEKHVYLIDLIAKELAGRAEDTLPMLESLAGDKRWVAL